MRLMLTRYVVRAVMIGAVLVLAVLVSLDSVFTFIGEVDQVGRGDYSLGVAAVYMLLSMPSRIYELFPAAVAIGGILGLGGLAANSELTVMRAAGISSRQIAGMVLQAGLLLMVAIVAIGEGLAPPAQQHGERMRASAIAGQGDARGARGVWVRDGDRFVSVGTLLPNQVLRDVDIYEFADHRLQRALHVDRAIFVDGRWQLHDVDTTRIDAAGELVRGHRARAVWDELVRPELVDLLAVSPMSLSIWRLAGYVEYLRDNRLEATRFELAFWQKVATPLSTLVMLLLALPVIFGSLRSSGVGQRVFVGSLIGVGYFLASELFAHVGIVYGLAAPVAALAPVVLFATVGIVLLRRVN
ncbi:MAG: LPS export ABC transporter permease LptG [Halofilum sp. (in: g-proteobacteria)]